PIGALPRLGHSQHRRRADGTPASPEITVGILPNIGGTRTLISGDTRCAAPEGSPSFERTMDPKPVLVVDDDPDIRETLRFVLEDAGYPVYCAENGREALQVLEGAKHRPGLILLDLMMPIMSGEE